MTPSRDIPMPAMPIVTVAAPPQLADSGSTPSESSTEEQVESETSLATSLTMSPPQPHPHIGPSGLLQDIEGQMHWAGSPEQQHDRVEEEEEIIEDRQRTRKRSRRRAYSLSLLGTSADSGLSVTAAEMEGRLWDGAAGSPQYSNALHHLWMMTYNHNTPYLSSDDSDSDDEEMLEELQELREK